MLHQPFQMHCNLFSVRTGTGELQLLPTELGSKQTGALPTVGTAEATSLLNKCIHKAQSCKTVIKYCTFCL